MKILIDNRSGQELPITHIEELAAFVLMAEGLPEDIELSVSFVDLEEITSLNTMYRNKAEPTDVLSFELDPFLDEKSFADEEGFTVGGGGDLEQILIGDIVINPDVAAKHAKLDEVSFEEELWLLLIHGILHLVGYDHEDADDQELMEEKEDRYFIQWVHKVENR